MDNLAPEKKKSRLSTTPRKLLNVKSITSAAARGSIIGNRKSKNVVEIVPTVPDLAISEIKDHDSPVIEKKREKKKKNSSGKIKISKRRRDVQIKKLGTFAESSTNIQRVLAKKPEYSTVNESLYPHEVYQRLANNLFNAIGLDKETTRQIDHLIINSKAMRSIKNNHMCDLIALRSIEAMAKDIALFNSYQYSNQAALVIQTQIRKYRAVKEKEKVKREWNENKIKAFYSLIKREKVYVMNLATVVSQYIMPLSISPDKQLKQIENELKVIFSNIEQILSVHQTFLNTLYELSDSSWPSLRGLGSLIVSIAPHWKTYGIYVNNFKYARDLLFECQEQSEHFRMFLDNNTMKLSMDLNMLLSLPLNHIAGYELILKSILDEESDPTQNSDLLQAILIATETSNFIANALGKADNIANIQRVKRSFAEGEFVAIEIAGGGGKGSQGLQYVNECSIEFIQYQNTGGPSKKDKMQGGYLILLSNLAIISYSSNKGLLVKHFYKLAETTIEPSETNPLSFHFLVIDEERPAYDNIVEGTRYEIIMDSTHKRDKWVQDLRNLISRNQRFRTFGVPLEHVVEREKPEGDIPIVVRDLIEYLLDEGLTTVGLFRIPGTSTVVKRLRMAYNQSVITGKYPVLKEIDDFRPNDAAGLLKMFFHDLPEPLIPYPMFSKFLANQTNYSSSEMEAMIAELRMLVHSLPSVNFRILKYLVEFMRKVAENQEENKMSSENLAMCFGPNIIRPEEQSIESTLLIPKANGCIARMVDYFDYIFAPL